MLLSHTYHILLRSIVVGEASLGTSFRTLYIPRKVAAIGIVVEDKASSALVLDGCSLHVTFKRHFI